jgi:type I restriction enzyme, S subunit
LVAEDGANDLDNYPVQYVNGKVWVNNHAHVLRGRQGIAENRFLKYAFNQVDMKVHVVGGGRAKLNAETLMAIELYLPGNVDEQQVIGTYFHTIDALTDYHATQLQKLQQIKSACLEAMFA